MTALQLHIILANIWTTALISKTLGIASRIIAAVNVFVWVVLMLFDAKP